LLLASAVTSAQQPAAAPGAASSFLWHVRSPSTSLYLLGSVHIMKPDAYPLSEAIETAFESAKVVILEINPDEMASAGWKAIEKGSLPDGKTLSDVVSRETYQLTSERLRQLELDPEIFARSRPWMLAVTLTAIELQRAGYSQSEGVDLHFYRRAREAEKRLMGLETAEYQIGLFAGLSRADDEAFLRYTLNELETAIPLVDRLIASWKAGEVDEVGALLSDGYDEFPQLFERLVADRNRRWMPQLERLLRGGETAFAVVGALHLVGENGLIEMLERRGFTVEQL
jgi:uncharacterized protein YbaP (TraB family)